MPMYNGTWMGLVKLFNGHSTRTEKKMGISYIHTMMYGTEKSFRSALDPLRRKIILFIATVPLLCTGL